MITNLKKLFFLLCLLLVVACGKDDEKSNIGSALPDPDVPIETPKKEPIKLNITDATSLFISTTNNTSKSVSPNSKFIQYSTSSPDSQRLFKITESGYIEEVTFTDIDGNEVITTNEPTNIIDINTEFLFVDFSVGEGYLVQKQTGHIYSLDNVGKPHNQLNDYKNAKDIYTDKNGNIYYKRWAKGYNNNPMEVIKIDTSQLDNLTASIYSPDTEFVDNFKVDNEGNMLYLGRLRSEVSGSISKRRLKKSNGGLENLQFDTYWLSPDNDSFYGIFGAGISNVSVSNNTSESHVYSEIIMSYPPMSSSYIFYFPNKILVGSSYLVELYNHSDSLILDDSMSYELIGHNLEMINVTDAKQSSSYVYVAGLKENKGVLIKFNPQTNEYVDLLLRESDEYDIFKFSVANNDEVTFNALRMSDGKKVLGTIDAQGNLEIIDDVNNIETIVLERIN